MSSLTRLTQRHLSCTSCGTRAYAAETDAYVDKIVARVRPSKAAVAANGDAAAADEDDEDAPKLLEAPVIMLEKLQSLEKMISSLIKTELNLKEDQFTNKLIQTWSDPSNKEDELLDEAAMRARAKQGAAGPDYCALRQKHAAHIAIIGRPASRTAPLQRRSWRSRSARASSASSRRRHSATSSSKSSHAHPSCCTPTASLSSFWAAGPPTLCCSVSRWSWAVSSCWTCVVELTGISLWKHRLD